MFNKGINKKMQKNKQKKSNKIPNNAAFVLSGFYLKKKSLFCAIKLKKVTAFTINGYLTLIFT